MPAMIVAEIGVNFNGDRSRIPAFIEAAKNAGADAVKFQAYNTDKLVQRRGITDQKTIDLLRRNELTDDDMALIQREAGRVGIKHFWSVFDPEQPARCVKFGACALKIGHKECGWAELLNACWMVADGISLWVSGGSGNVAGTWEYPAVSPPKLGRIVYGAWIGFSSHYADWRIPAAAAMGGARYIEFHTALEPTDPEAAWSLFPDDARKCCEQIRLYESWL